jgi:RNA polymerase sigma-70 factor (ECF subfamily)
MSKPMERDMGWPGDDRLVEQAKQGNVEAFAELARRFEKRIQRAILALTGNLQDADDLTQETFMQAYKTLKDFKQQASFFTWLYRIAINLTLNFLKRKKKERMKETLNENLPLELNSETLVDSPEQNSLEKELSEKLKEAIDSLPIPYRASFVLVVFQGMTHGEAAQILRCSENTVSWRMHKARKMLQAKLKPYLREK